MSYIWKFNVITWVRRLQCRPWINFQGKKTAGECIDSHVPCMWYKQSSKNWATEHTLAVFIYLTDSVSSCAFAYKQTRKKKLNPNIHSDYSNFIFRLNSNCVTIDEILWKWKSTSFHTYIHTQTHSNSWIGFRLGALLKMPFNKYFVRKLMWFQILISCHAASLVGFSYHCYMSLVYGHFDFNRKTTIFWITNLFIYILSSLSEVTYYKQWKPIVRLSNGCKYHLATTTSTTTHTHQTNDKHFYYNFISECYLNVFVATSRKFQFQIRNGYGIDGSW